MKHLVGIRFLFAEMPFSSQKPCGEEWSRRESRDARDTQWNFDVEMDAGRSETT